MDHANERRCQEELSVAAFDWEQWFVLSVGPVVRKHRA
jgi:hypothetical protein